jgi:hypothetical protein
MTATGPRATWAHTAGMSVLLVMLVATIFIVPVAAPPLGDSGRAVIELFFLLVLAAGGWAIAEHRRAALALAALGAVIVAIAWLPVPIFGPATPVVRQVAALLAVILLAVMVSYRVFAPGRITTDRIMGAVALYLLFGVTWGNAYEIVALLDPAAFSAAADTGRGIERWFYFSFVTLTTVGYGDVTPVSRAARVLAIGEALVGQLYPAIILARLVTLQTSEPPAAPPAA